MALSDPGNLKVGGVVLDVGLDLQQLRSDLDSVGPMLERFARDTKLNLDVAARPSGGGPAGTSGSAGPASPAASRALMTGLATTAVGSIERAMATVQSSLQKVGTDLARSLDGVVDKLQQVVGHAKASARVAVSTEKAANDLRRAERAEHHTAQQERLADRALGYRQAIRPKPGNTANLPADVRYLAGIGFDPTSLVPKGTKSKAGARLTAAAPASAAAGHAGDVLARAGIELQKAAADLRDAAAAIGRAGRSTRPKRGTRGGGQPAYASPTRPGHPDAGAPIDVPAGFDDPNKTVFVRGSARQQAYYRSRPGHVPDPGFSKAVLPMAGAIPSYAPGGGRGARSGKVTIPSFSELKSVAGQAGKAIQSIAEGGIRAQAAVRAVGSVGAYSFNRLLDGARGVERQIGRVEIATRGLRAIAGTGLKVLTTPFTLAARAVGIWDARVGAGTNTLRLLGKVAAPLGNTLAAPFRAASAAAGKLSGLMQGLVAGAVTGLGSALAGMAVKGVLASAKMNDSVNAVKSVFKGSADEVTAFATEMGGQFGRVKKDILDSSVAIGGAFKGAGMGTQEAAGRSRELVERAADVAAQRQAPGGVAEVSHAMSMAVSGGSTRGLRQFGIAIDDDAIKARALALGLVGAGKEMGATARASAVYSLILEKSADAQGFLSKNATSTETLMEALTGRFTNAAAALGAKLEPAFTEILLLLDEFLVGTTKATKAVHDWVGGIVEGVVEGVRFLRKMWQSWDDGVALVRALGSQMQENLADVFLYIGNVAGKVFDWLSANWRAVFEDMWTVTKRLAGNVAGIFGDMIAEMRKAFSGDILNVDLGKFDIAANLAKLTDMSGEKFVAPPLVIDKFKFTGSFTKQVADLYAKIMGTEIRLPTKDAHRDLEQEGEDREGKDRKGKGSKDKTGELMDAKALLDSLQRSVFDKDSDHIAETARNTGEQVRGLAVVAGAIGDLRAALGPAAAPDGRAVAAAVLAAGHAAGQAAFALPPGRAALPPQIQPPPDPRIARIEALKKSGMPFVAEEMRKQMEREKGQGHAIFDIARAFPRELAKAGMDLIGHGRGADGKDGREGDQKKILAKSEEHARKQVELLGKISGALARGVVAVHG